MTFAEQWDQLMDDLDKLIDVTECKTPGGGLGPGSHCAACCYQTGIEASSMAEFEAFGALRELRRLGERLRAV